MSDEELQSLRSETESLEGELQRLTAEADILNRALDNAYREKDRLQDRLDALTNPRRTEADDGALVSLQDGGGAPAVPDGQSPPPGGQRTYKVVRGDTLNQIAKNHNTTMDVLLRLNPFLRDRPQLMVWENDTLILPGGQPQSGGSSSSGGG